ncbi:DUF2130 domain-containing protein [Chloroflexota bacterium]
MRTTESHTTVKCPKCGTEFPLTEALLEPLRVGLQKDLAEQYEKQLKEKTDSLEIEAKKRAEEEAALTAKDLQEQVKETSERLKKSQETEIELRKKGRELERKQEEFELEMSRKLDEQRKQTKEELEKDYTLKISQQEEQMTSMKKQIDELKRKAEQGSQQAQGEALERKLEDLLKDAFPYDLIEPVPKGISGADVIQRVNGKSGQCCGTIVWESKNTKNWSKSWIDKLKENQREIKAEIAVLATVVLPSEISSFSIYEGVWVTHWSFACQLAYALRINLIEMQESKVAQAGKEHKMELLYDYLISPQFKQRVETVVGAFGRMRKDLADERQSMERIWSKREKQIDLVMKGTAGLYGDMQGIAGAVIPEIEALQMPYQLESGDAEDE